MTTRQNIINCIAVITAMKPENKRWGGDMMATITAYRNGSDTTLAEINYLDKLSLRAYSRFFTDCTHAATALIALNQQKEAQRKQEEETHMDKMVAGQAELDTPAEPSPRKKLVRELAEVMALDPEKYRPILTEEIERRFKGFWATPSERDYWNGLTQPSKTMFINDVSRMFEETAAAWGKNVEEFNRWVAEEAAAAAAAAADNEGSTIHSAEYEAVDEIIAEEAAEEAAAAELRAAAAAELKAAAAAYEAAEKRMNGWSILLDEGGPIGYEDRIAVDNLQEKKHSEIMAYKAADFRLTMAALAMAKVL